MISEWTDLRTGLVHKRRDEKGRFISPKEEARRIYVRSKLGEGRWSQAVADVIKKCLRGRSLRK